MPTTANESQETLVEVPGDLARRGATHVLRVKGDSLKGEGIYDGDYLIVRDGSWAREGELVIGTIKGKVMMWRHVVPKPYEYQTPECPACVERERKEIVRRVIVGLIRHY